MFYAHTYRGGRLLLGNVFHVAGVWRHGRLTNVIRDVRQDSRGRPGDIVEIEQVPNERPYAEGRVVARVSL